MGSFGAEGWSFVGFVPREWPQPRRDQDRAGAWVRFARRIATLLGSFGASGLARSRSEEKQPIGFVRLEGFFVADAFPAKTYGNQEIVRIGRFPAGWVRFARR